MSGFNDGELKSPLAFSLQIDWLMSSLWMLQVISFVKTMLIGRGKLINIESLGVGIGTAF